MSLAPIPHDVPESLDAWTGCACGAARDSGIGRWDGCGIASDNSYSDIRWCLCSVRRRLTPAYSGEKPAVVQAMTQGRCGIRTMSGGESREFRRCLCSMREPHDCPCLHPSKLSRGRRVVGAVVQGSALLLWALTSVGAISCRIRSANGRGGSREISRSCPISRGFTRARIPRPGPRVSASWCWGVRCLLWQPYCPRCGDGGLWPLSSSGGGV